MQSIAENKSPNTPEETHGKVFYQPKHRAGPETSPIAATFLPLRKIIPEQLVGARRPHPCIPQITLSLLLLLPFALMAWKHLWENSLASNHAFTGDQRLQNATTSICFIETGTARRWNCKWCQGLTLATHVSSEHAGEQSPRMPPQQKKSFEH